MAMPVSRMVVFDLWGDYAHFRKGYSTTSSLSFPFPSRTTISGMIAAILGFERDSYYEILGKENSLFALQILAPIRKTTINLNLIDTKSGFFLRDNKTGLRSQIPVEVIKNPKYRLYIWLKDETLMERLYELVKQKKTTYTLYLGISEFIANFAPVNGGITRVSWEHSLEKTLIHSIVDKKQTKIIIEPEKVYGTVKAPGFMNNKRVVREYFEFFYEESGDGILIKDDVNYLKAEDLNVNLIPF